MNFKQILIAVGFLSSIAMTQAYYGPRHCIRVGGYWRNNHCRFNAGPVVRPGVRAAVIARPVGRPVVVARPGYRLRCNQYGRHCHYYRHHGAHYRHHHGQRNVQRTRMYTR